MTIITIDDLQNVIDKCEKAIISGIPKGMSYDEFNSLLTYASALIVIKADIQHAERFEIGCEEIVNKYLEKE